MQPIQQDLVIYQGATFSNKLQWCSAEAVHKVITAVQVGLPTLVTATGHGLTARTPVWITNVKGPRDLNTANYRDACPRGASMIDADTLAIDFDSGSMPPYQSGGVLTYYPPMDLTGYTARMQARSSVGAADTLLDLTTENSGIVIDPATGTIELRIDATDTAALAWTQGVYDLELVDATGFTTRLAQGSVSVEREVTR
jgi:hypothetical protein